MRDFLKNLFSIFRPLSFAIVVYLLIVASVVNAQQLGPVSVSGDHVNINVPDSAASGIHIQAPNAAALFDVFLGGSQFIAADGGGTARVPKVFPAAAATPVAVAGSGTIDTTVIRGRVTTAGAVTGVILENGVYDGQLFFLQVDKDAAGSITMAAEGTSNVCSGTGAVIAAGEGALFVFDSTDTCWTEFGT